MTADLVSILNSNGGVTSVLADRVYPVLLPENPTLPAATYQVIYAVPEYTLGGALALMETRLQVDTWGLRYGDCQDSAAAIRTALEGAVGTMPSGTIISSVEMRTSMDLYDTDARLYRVKTDFVIIATS